MEENTFRDRSGRIFSICRLTRDLAEEHADRIIWLHNFIPFQYWDVDDLLREADAMRPFYGKWEISRLAFGSDRDVIGFCIGFELAPDGIYYHRPGVYMHRLSVDPLYRRSYIGAMLQAEASYFAFERGMRHIISRDDVVLYGQTNDVPENVHMLKFYDDAGFRIVGQKPYSDRVDVIMEMTRQSFFASRHAQLRGQILLNSDVSNT